MTRLKGGILLAALCALPIPLKAGTPEPLEVFFENGLCGYKRGSAVVAPARFEYCGRHAAGLAQVVEKTRDGSRGKMGFLDLSGSLAIPMRFDDAGEFSEGLARARVGRSFGFIDRSGRFVVEPQFLLVRDFREGLACVTRENYKYGFIDKSGKLAVPAVFDEAGDFSEGMAPVRQGAKWGFVDRSGRPVVRARFDETGGFSEGYAAVREGKLWGFVDRAGNLVIKPEFEEGGVFRKDAEGRLFAEVKKAGRTVRIEPPPQAEDRGGKESVPKKTK